MMQRYETQEMVAKLEVMASMPLKEASIMHREVRL